MVTFTKLTQIAVASDEQIISMARRHANVGAYMVQQWYMSTWARGDITKGAWHTMSCHLSQEAADKALARLNRKLAKG